MQDKLSAYRRKLEAFVQGNADLLDQARSAREGFSPAFIDEAGFESAPIRLPPSSTPVSADAYNAIVMFEVSSEAAYRRLYERPIWPGGQSGVTIGIGYDLGYVTAPEFEADWKGVIPDAAIERLGTTLGKAGGSANSEAAMKALTQSVRDVATPFEGAATVFRQRSLPLYVALTEHSLPNTDALGPNSLGALVSLVYNRGAPFQRTEDRFREMRAIRQHMSDRAFDEIPAEFRCMQRLWPNLPGLQKRRELEAELFAMDL
jgi:hypothetical protein